MKLVIVESPTKARTISKFLGSDYVVKASMGHVRDLPASSAEIPAKYAGEKWAKIGVNVERDFEPLYITPTTKKKVVKELKDLVAKSEEVILATDEDREGEAISWHLAQLLKLKNPKRIAFHEITDSAIAHALKHPREIKDATVQAQEARRILDRLVGYGVSPVLWKKIKFGLSAGRVQSVAMRLIVNREKERLNFTRAKYGSITATLSRDDINFDTTLQDIDGRKIAQSKDFTKDGKLSNPELLVVDDKSLPQIVESAENAIYKILDVTKSQIKRQPQAPYITSTLQIDANRKLGFSARQTMQVAQKLYENGLITYMRTDSPNLSQIALDGIKKQIVKMYGNDSYAGFARQFKSKSKGAQEAHEAIRPAGDKFLPVTQLSLTSDEASLYDLIWKRTMASQMLEATLDQTSVTITANHNSQILTFRTAGTRVTNPGFLKAYNMDESVTEGSQNLPSLEEGDTLKKQSVTSKSHETQPPARFNDASLVKTLEAEGVGRPSTYASIISTIQSRGYIKRISNQLIPTFAAFAVNNLLEKYFSNLVDTEFTAHMEAQLDRIEEGDLKWVPYLKDFYLSQHGLESTIKLAEDKIDPKEISTILLPCVNASNPIRYGKFGAYVDFGEVKATIPEDVDLSQIDQKFLENLKTTKSVEDEAYVTDRSGNPVYLKTGRFGPYLAVKLTQDSKSEVATKAKKGTKSKKPQDLRFVSVPPQIGVDNLTQELALKLIELPRLVGKNPKGEQIFANFGRFGPYVQIDKTYASIPKDADVFTISLDEAQKLIEEKLANPKKSFRRFAKKS